MKRFYEVQANKAYGVTYRKRTRSELFARQTANGAARRGYFVRVEYHTLDDTGDHYTVILTLEPTFELPWADAETR